MNTGRTHFKKGNIPWNKGMLGYLVGTEHPWMPKKEKHWHWKGGITPINIQIRNSTEGRKWREKVFSRDRYTCVECGAKNGNGKTVVLHADHIKPFAHYPELRFDISNGRTLCIDCHKQTETYAGKCRKN